MVRGMNRLELFVSRGRINPFVSNELHERIKNPILKHLAVERGWKSN